MNIYKYRNWQKKIARQKSIDFKNRLLNGRKARFGATYPFPRP